jgi:hypothetical protein
MLAREEARHKAVASASGKLVFETIGHLGEDQNSPPQWRDYRRCTRHLTRIMHHSACFFTSLGLARAGDPSVWIGVRQLAVQHVWD